ncbi:MAG TPA: fibronectin type III domain-containing protein [candidate division Zixibacteria bacterium]
MKKRRSYPLILFLLLGFLLIWVIAFAQEESPLPPSQVKVKDTPNDNGHSLTITWKSSPDSAKILGYEILRSDSPDGEFKVVGQALATDTLYKDKGDKEKESPNYFPSHKNFYYKVRAKTDGLSSESEISLPAYAFQQWYHAGKTPVLVAVLIFSTLTLIFISKAKKGKELYVRPLAGIGAVDEAIGRATEMGRPILFILGLGTAADIATIAGFTILSRVAKRTAEYKTRIIVPCNDPIVMAVAQETVKAAYMDAGRPEAYEEKNIFFLTSMQFAYVAGVNGIMLRERTATNFYMGLFYAESLILAETGSIAGSIQISGTDQMSQLPFFVAATDYTLIGEELYAASAYLGREPLLLGALKAQDWAKGILLICLILGTIFTSLHLDFFANLFKFSLE